MPRIRPALGWAFLAAFLMVAGPAGCLFTVGSAALDMIRGADHYGRIELPVEGRTIEFPEAISDGTIYQNSPNGNDGVVEMSLVGPDGRRVKLTSGANRTFDYETGSDRAKLTELATFKITEPGIYRLNARSTASAKQWLWVGRSGLTSVVKRSGVPALVGSFVGMVGLVLLVVVLIRRGSARRAVGFAPPGGPGFPPVGGAAGFSPPPGYSPTWPAGTPPPPPGFPPPPSPPPPPTPAPPPPPPPPPPPTPAPPVDPPA